MTLLVAIIGLFFIWDEMKKLTDIVRTFETQLGVSSLTSTADLTIKEDMVFVEHPELVKFFWDGVPIVKTDSNYDNSQSRSVSNIRLFR